MTDQEIQDLIATVVFDDPKETEVVVNVPLYVPKVLFMDQINAYAKSVGWQETVKDEQGADIPNPENSLKFLATRIRGDVRQGFTVFVARKARREANAAAQEQIQQIFS